MSTVFQKSHCAAVLFSLLNIFFQQISADPTCSWAPHYQDMVVNGKVVIPGGGGDCELRYKSIKQVLDQYQRPFTMIDIGAAQGYFSFRAAYDYDAVSVIVEGARNDQLLELCRKNDQLDNIIYLNKTFDVASLEALAACEHFDVVLLFNVAHHVPNWRRFIDAVFALGDNIIIETPPANDRYFHKIGRAQHIKDIENYFWSKGDGTVICERARHTDAQAKSKTIWFKKSKKAVEKTHWLSPKDQSSSCEVISDFNRKVFKDSKSLLRNWIPGISLLTFKMLNGRFPEVTSIKDCLQSGLFGNFLWDLAIQGNSIEPRKPEEGDAYKLLSYNLGLLDLSAKGIQHYISEASYLADSL